MAFPVLLRIAARNLFRNRRRSLITLTAIFVAVAMMVLMRGFNNGVNRLVRDQVIESQGALQIHRKGFSRSIISTPLDLDMPADAAFLSRLRSVPHVQAIAPRIPCGGLVSTRDLAVFAAFIAVDPAEESRVCPQLFSGLKTGHAIDPQHTSGSVLTQLLASRIGAGLGDAVALVSTDRDGVMNAIELPLSGVVKDVGQHVAEKKIVYVPLARVQELLRMPNRATELAVRIDDLAQVDAVATALRQQLGPDFEVVTYRDLIKFDEEASRSRDQGGAWITYIFLSLSLLGIINTMLTSVRERTREIGTMMAIGIRKGHILSLFLTEAALLGSLASGLGLGVATLLVIQLGRQGLTLPADDGVSTFTVHPYIGAGFVLQIFFIAVLGALLAAFYPALRASRLRPIQALSQVLS